MKLGEQIYFYRKRSKLSQEELAEQIGVSRQAVSKWERGEAAPDVDKLVALARVFGVTVDQLLQTGAEEPPGGEEAPDSRSAGGEDSLDRVGGLLGKMIRRYGWLFGVYVSLSGLGIAFVGGLARAAAKSMLSGVNQMMGNMGGLGGGWTYSGPPELEAEIMGQLGIGSPAAAMSSPFLLIATGILILGLVIAAAGGILAAVLYRRGRK